MKINRERTGFGVSVRTELSASCLKEKMSRAAESISGVFVPSDVIWDQDKYSFYVSHRQSLKEYIAENGLNTSDFLRVAGRVRALFQAAAAHNIDPYDFLFDYECVFVGISVEELEFIYAPDSDTYKDGTLVYNKCSDMLALISLHIEYKERNRTSTGETKITRLLALLSEWEADPTAERRDFPEACQGYFSEQAHETFDCSAFFLSRKWFFLFESAVICVFLLWFFHVRGSTELVSAILLCLSVMIFGGYLLFPIKGNIPELHLRLIPRLLEQMRRYFGQKQEKKEVCEMELNGDMLLKGMHYIIDDNRQEEIHIGRDSDWADIPVGLIFVSRKHAALHKKRDKWYIEDLQSTNGTFVNGTKIPPERLQLLKNGSEISLGLPESKFIFRLP